MAYGGSFNTDDMSDETFEFLCRACKGEGRNKEAEKYCVDCTVYYCSSCVNVHSHIPALSGHSILDKSQFPSGSVKKQLSAKPGSIKSKFRAPTERCDRHSHHYIDMYCQNHDDVGCGTCFAVDHTHRLCKDVFYIPEFLQNNASAVNTSDIQKKLESVTKTLKALHENFKLEKKQLLKKKLEFVESIREFRVEINDRLDELERNTVADIEDKYKILVDKLQEGLDELDSTRVMTVSARDKIASPDNNQSQHFVYAKKGNIVAKKAVTSLEKIKASANQDDVDFIPDLRITALLAEINMLGETAQKGTQLVMSADGTGNLIRVNQEGSTATTGQQKQSLLQVRGSKRYSVKVKQDKSNCNIVSACTMSDGTIILSDCDSRRLKQLDSTTYTVIGYCDLPGNPWQVCPINAHEVAICLIDKQAVYFVTIGKNMKISKKTIATDFNCYGLAYAAGNLYIADSNTVYIYTVSGRKLKQFSEDQSGRALFSYFRSLTVSENGSRIYVTVWDNGLIVLDSDGRVVGRFNDSRLRNAFGSYLTDEGSLVVCGYSSNNVLQFGRNGELMGEVVKSAGNCEAICCNHKMSKLVIGRFKNDEIEVYDMVKASV